MKILNEINRIDKFFENQINEEMLIRNGAIPQEEINFNLNVKESKMFIKFQKKHSKCSKNSGAIGGIFKVIFTPTSIGSFVELECTRCGKKKDITDTKKL